jgi:NADP-dependent 3-hydroxy acid dehydrogenase YdfG
VSQEGVSPPASRQAHQPTDLSGKVALVTGASSGLGQAIADALAGRGVRLALSARRGERLSALATRLREGGTDALGLPGDVRDQLYVESIVRQTLERWGQLDILVANAGLGYRAPIAEGDPARWKELLDINVFGLLLTLRFGVPPMLSRRSGHVIVLSSVAARVVQAGNGVYSGTKMAVNAIAEALRQEVTRQGVRVTSIEPGVVQTAFQDVAGYSPELRRSLLEDQHPLAPADIAGAVLYALEQPPHASINEVLIRPTDQVTA